MEPIIPEAATEADLDEALGSDAARESFYAYGGALAQLLARLGAYTHHPIDETDYHDQKGVGYPHGRMRKDSIPRDPTLRFEEYAHLLSRTRRSRVSSSSRPGPRTGERLAAWWRGTRRRHRRCCSVSPETAMLPCASRG